MFVAIATVAIVSVAVSCKKEVDQSIQSNPSLKIGASTLSLTQSERNDFAEAVAVGMSKNTKSYKELRNAIDSVLSYGAGESLSLYDILKPMSSVFIADASRLSNLHDAIDGSGVVSAYSLSSSDYYSNIQLYWPYHDEWDSTTIPVICFAPDDETAL